jgi:hypothetical protein
MKTTEPTVVSLQHLPIVGKNVIVFTTGGQCKVPEARVMRDDLRLHINVIGRSQWRSFPFISSTTELPLKDVLLITY